MPRAGTKPRSVWSAASHRRSLSGAERRRISLLAFLLSLVCTSPALATCAADCDGDHVLSADEMRAGVTQALGEVPLDSCPGFDRDGDGEVAVDDLVAAVGSALPGCTPQTRALVLTTNFMAGSFATVDLDEPRTVSRSTPQRRVHSDAVVRTHGGQVYVVNRLFGDNLQRLDPSDGFATRFQCSTGNGTNPHDVAFASGDKAYISLFEKRELLVVNPAPQADCSDFIRGSIDLGSLADADGIPDMDQMAVVGGRLYVSLQRLDLDTALRLPAGRGVLAVVDVATDTLVGGIELSGENPFASTKGLTVRGGKIYVAESGRFGVMDGGIERVDLATGRAEGFFVTEEDLGGDVTDFVLVSEHLAYAVVSRPGFKSALVAFDPVTATVTQTLIEKDGYVLFDVELNDRDEIWVADRTRQHDGVRVYRAADGAALTSDPLDLGLAPFEIVFLP